MHTLSPSLQGADTHVLSNLGQAVC